ncbi:phospholipase D1 [Naviculisporaceae sp. PSN 640]
MAEATRSDPAVLSRKQTAMSSGVLSELPTIPQHRALFSGPSPVGSDEFDFAKKHAVPSPETVAQGSTESQPLDYLAAGLSGEGTTPQNAPPPPSLTVVTSPTIPSSPKREPSAPETPDAPSPSQHRRSVQFARDEGPLDPPPKAHVRQGSWDARDAVGKIRGSAFMARLKELAGPSSAQGSKAPGGFGDLIGSTASSPTVTRQSTRAPRGVEDGSDEDADAEETADERNLDARNKQKKKRRHSRRPRLETLSSSSVPRVAVQGPDTPGSHSRLGFLRRATLSDVTDRGVFSEGEGRDQFNSERGIRRMHPWTGGQGDDGEEAESPSGRRLGHFRRISAFGGGGGGMSDGDAMTPRRPFFGADRATTFGAHKWRQVKGALKLLRTQKKDDQFDYFKSAELMAELRAVTPAVLILASMIQRDEHGNKRIPVLLEQLRLRIKDSAAAPGKESERHSLFTIELEYGSGPSQMRWTIKRTIREILNLHWKYKLTLNNEKFPTNRLDLGTKPKQPRFPLSAFPYLRGVRGVDDHDEEDLTEAPLPPPPPPVRPGDETAGEMTAGEGTIDGATDVEGRPPVRKKRSRMTVLGGRRKSSALGSAADLSQNASEAVMRKRYVERQQRMLEKYLQEMIRWLMFRADSNRLCRFFELSALGVRLAAEGSYHGKECYLHIQSSKGLDFRRVLTPGKVIARHSRKWFLVRQSYIVCVESPENMNIYDVYLVDPKFKLVPKTNKNKFLAAIGHDTDNEEEFDPTADNPPTKHHTLKILTSERKVKLFSPNQHLIQQFEESIVEMLRKTPWHRQNRFGSFAPVRTGVHAQWLVDGRDYMWNVSRAISMAKDVIYIHDWWLSPELYMRRPACISQKWRLDRLLQKKAQEGVKIFVIVYRNVEAAIPIDSEYTKFSLLNLHPNIFVQRSPNQFKKNQFFFAHHEKICIVDHDIAFVGGIDLCFGRWDSPQHPVADDKPTGFELDGMPKDAEHCQLFPGKDYSNPRVLDFFRLNEPYEEMYDRGRIPRMPWHDISMQVVGQPARDLTRHFVQRWNYVRRGRKPTRPTPFLLPPPDANQEELESVGLSGTCEVQILRSASTWSLGVEDTEHSIQSAYIKMIEDSDHFVYMENQFFITSTETLNNKMVNRIGDALVERIIRAHKKDEDWRAVILIPLMPGFQNEVNEQDGTSVRLILQCQFRSICRGEHSIFGRLRAAGIDPEDYIQFFSLRQWGKLGNNILTTEQLYIHAKCIIVDDRVALIGSANINERSMLGNRDSECAAVVRDTDMIWSTMAGRPYQVGRFAHTLRLRLMREHLGLDVDEILEEERQMDLDERGDFETEMDRIYSDDSAPATPVAESSRLPKSEAGLPASPPRLHSSHSYNHDVDLEKAYSPERPKSAKGKSKSKSIHEDEEDVDIRGIGSDSHMKEVEGFGPDHWKAFQQAGMDQGRDTIIINGREVLVRDIISEGKGTIDHPKAAHKIRHFSEPAPSPGGVGDDKMPPMPAFDRRTTEQLGLPRANQLPTLPVVDDTDIGGPPLHLDSSGKPTNAPPTNPLAADIKLADIHKDCMRDPLNPSFYDDVWCRVAENNTKVYRRVFRCMPDSEVTNWTEYKEFHAYNQRFKQSMEGPRSSEEHEEKSHSGTQPPQSAAGGAGIGAPGPAAAAKSLADKLPSPLPKIVNAGEHLKSLGSSPDPNMDEKAALGHHQPDSDLAAVADLPTDPEKAAETTLRTSTDVLSLSPSAAISDSRPLSASTNRLEPDARKERRPTFSNQEKPPATSASASSATPNGFGIPISGTTSNNEASTVNGGSSPAKLAPAGSQRRTRRRATTRGSRRGFSPLEDVLPVADAEELLNMTQGALVQFPYDWLVREENTGNWLFQVDQVAPLQI